MASRKFFNPRPNYIHPITSYDPTTTSSDSAFEFDESDVWSTVGTNHDESSPIPTGSSRRTKPISRSSSRNILAGGKMFDRPSAAASLPVTIPDWSETRDDVSDGDDDVDDRVPPHVYLARARGASLSVHEGAGRTLKGRDLRRVRNAIWKRVGFED